MTQQRRTEEEDAPRDPVLEAAFTHLVQQAQVSPEFTARVRARIEALAPEVPSRSWPRRVATWLAGGGGRRGRRGTDLHEGRGSLRPWPGRVWTAVLATCLVLSVLGNVWLGMQLVGQTRSADPRARLRLAFVDTVREQDIRSLLLAFGATIIGGPSPQGVYLVQVPLPSRLRSADDPLRLLLEELRADPAVRLVEPVASAD